MSILQPYEDHARLLFTAEDLNQDGVLSLLEFLSLFNKYDANSEYLRQSRNLLLVTLQSLFYN